MAVMVTPVVVMLIVTPHIIRKDLRLEITEGLEGDSIGDNGGNSLDKERKDLQAVERL